MLRRAAAVGSPPRGPNPRPRAPPLPAAAAAPKRPAAPAPPSSSPPTTVPPPAPTTAPSDPSIRDVMRNLQGLNVTLRAMNAAAASPSKPRPRATSARRTPRVVATGPPRGSQPSPSLVVRDGPPGGEEGGAATAMPGAAAAVKAPRR